MKLVINACFGGFNLSEHALQEYCRRRGISDQEMRNCCGYRGSGIPRDDPVLVSVVEELGENANGFCSCPIVEEIDDDLEGYWYIHEYDGAETIVIRKEAFHMHKKTAEILYATELSDEEKIKRFVAMFPPLPSMLKKAKVDALYQTDGPVAKKLCSKWSHG